MIPTSSLLSSIRHALNEASATGDDFSATVDEALLEFVRMAAPVVVMRVPAVYQVADTVRYGADRAECFFTRPDGQTAIRMEAPADFCRFLALQATSWPAPVFDVLAASHPSYRAQYSSVPGIGAGPNTPVAYLSDTPDADGEPHACIEAHAMSKAESFTLCYVRTPEVTVEQVRMDARLQSALAWTAAGLYLQTIGDAAGSKSAHDTAMEIIDNLNNILTL